MAHGAFYLETLPKFYREMTFLSYHEIDHRNEHYDPRKYITVNGFHPDCGLVTIVQGGDSAAVMSERKLPPEYDAYNEDRPQVRKSWAEQDAEGEFAFGVAIAKATGAGVIGTCIKSSVWDGPPRVLTPFEVDLLNEHGYEAYLAYRASISDPMD